MAVPRKIEFTTSSSEYFVLDSDQTFYFGWDDKVVIGLGEPDRPYPLSIQDIQGDLDWVPGKAKKAWNGEVVVTLAIDHISGLAGKLILEGRGHICSCYRERFAGLVVRATRITWNGTKLKELPPVEYVRLKDLSAKRGPVNLAAFQSDPLETSEGYFTGFREVYDAAWRILYRSSSSNPLLRDPLERGLIIVAGRTGSGKSNIVRGIINCILTTWSQRKPEKSDRNFHLVTFEDPIEKILENDPHICQKLGVDYTPREVDVDVTNIVDAMNEARRQTPSLYYIGEVRKDTDWKEILGFVEGGHLVIATTHAGSLVECFHKLMTGEDKKSPAARSRMCGLIRGILQIHQGQTVEQIGYPTKSFNIPTVWSRTPEGVAAYVSNGSSAILPGFHEPAELDLIPEELKEHIEFKGDSLCFKSDANPAPVSQHWKKGWKNDAGVDLQTQKHINALVDWETAQVTTGAPSACTLGRRWFARDLARQVSVPYSAAWGKINTEKLLREIEQKCIEWDLRGE